jgi:hypothetical protein
MEFIGGGRIHAIAWLSVNALVVGGSAGLYQFGFLENWTG